MPPFFFLLPMLFWIVVLGGGFYLAYRLVRAFEARGSGGAELDDLRKRMAQLEDTLDGMNKRVDRIDEAQEFTTRLLTDKPPAGELPAAGDDGDGSQ
jgi:hypothetical protein